MLPESISLEKLKLIRDEISSRRGTYEKMPVKSAASSSALTSNPIVQRQREVIGYRGAGKSLARPTTRCILFDGENISFDANLVIYINSTNIPPIVIINRIYETQKLLLL